MSWFSNLCGKIKSVAGIAGAFIQTSEGKATLDAFKKAGEMVLKARKGDKQEQAKIQNVAAQADQGDPAAKQGVALLQMTNDLAKQQEAQAAPAAVGIERPMNAELDATNDAYDWGWDGDE